MNNTRRKHIRTLIDNLCDLEMSIDELRGQEQDYFDNMPEGFAASQRGERAEEVVDLLEQAADSLEQAAGLLEEAAE